MKKAILSFVFLLISFGLVSAYTQSDVSTHNTPEDCWVTFDGSVYDLTEYVANHDKFMDIREWCGRDMTEDFQTKAGAGRDHRDGSYELLEKYNIGSLEASVVDSEDRTGTGYNIWIPVLVSLVLYWGTYFLGKKKIFGMSIEGVNAFWNTILGLTLLIPSLGFGLFMIIRYQKPSLWDIDFDFMYWHVELSIVMGILALSHLVQRFNLYIKQIKKNKDTV